MTKHETLPTTEVRISGPWMGDPSHPGKTYVCEWEASEWEDDEDEGERREWFDTLDEAFARGRVLLEYQFDASRFGVD